MKKGFFKIVSFIMSFVLVFGFSIFSYCEPVSGHDFLDDEHSERTPIEWTKEEATRFGFYLAYKSIPQFCGYVFGDMSEDEFYRWMSTQQICEENGIPYDEFIKNIDEYMEVYVEGSKVRIGNKLAEDLTPEDIAAPTQDMIKDMDKIHIELSDDFLNICKTFVDTYASQVGYVYLYTTPISNLASDSFFVDKSMYTATVNFLKHNTENICFFNYGGKFYKGDKICSYVGCVTSDHDGIYYTGLKNLGLYNEYYCNFALDWQTPDKVNFISCDYNKVTHEFSEYPDSTIGNDGRFCFTDYPEYRTKFASYNAHWVLPVSIVRQSFRVYKSRDDYKNASIGISDVYKVNGQEELKNNYTGNEIYNASSINYGTIQTYYNNYFNDNGEYPDYKEIEDYLNKLIDDMGKNTGTGTGSGTGSDSSLDFSFLGSIGNALGSLISAIGGLLSGIVEGIVNAFSGLISGISGLIETITSGLPTAFSQFLSSLLGFLPDEIVALITLSITAMVLVGIIRLIRG